MKKFCLVMLLTFVALTAFVATQQGFAQVEPPKAKVLFYHRSQGFEHEPAKLRPDGTTVAGNALIKYGAARNIEVICTYDGSVFDGDISQYAAFVFYNSGNIFGEARNNSVAGSKPMTEAGFQKLLNAVKSGKGFVGIHSASDASCGKNNAAGVDIYTAFVGARFEGHGPQQFGTLTITEPIQLPHLKDSGKRITTWEEWYGMKDFNPDMHVILVQETDGMEGGPHQRPPHPSSWIRKEGDGRVAYSAFGHDNWYFRNAENVRRIGELIEWTIGRFELDTTPNYEKVTPKGNQLRN